VPELVSWPCNSTLAFSFTEGIDGTGPGYEPGSTSKLAPAAGETISTESGTS
jgi:hypothetical protein